MAPREGKADLVHLVPWGQEDLPLLERLLGDPRMMTHLGGPESAEKLRSRQKAYEAIERLADSSTSRTLKVVDTATGQGAGWVGYWELTIGDEQVYEIGWSVVPEFQGRGFATLAATQALDILRPAARHRYAHATPSVENAASNAICRKVGFVLRGESDVEYPPGRVMRANDWWLEL